MVFYIAFSAYQQETEIEKISPEHANQLIQDDKDSFNFFILDLRTYKDWSEERLDNSVNIDELVLEGQEDTLALEKDRTYLVYSQKEEESAKNDKILNIMQGLNLQKIYYLEGGIDAWIKQGFFTVFFKTIPPKEAFELIKKNKENPDFAMIDLRSPEQHKEEYIENSVNIPFRGEDFLSRLNTLNKNKIYLIHCKVGSIGKRTLGKMEQQGFKQVYNIEGGIKNWIEKGFPTIKP
jgi:rhodanese-related sulfurtransferase